MTSSRSTVLLVEDNDALAESMMFALGTVGWDVIGPFASAQDAIVAMREAPFDVAILDFDLGDATSLDVAERLRELERPFLFMTGHESVAEIPEAYRNETCLPKPVQLASLTAELDRLVRGASIH